MRGLRAFLAHFLKDMGKDQNTPISGFIWHWLGTENAQNGNFFRFSNRARGCLWILLRIRPNLDLFHAEIHQGDQGTHS